MEDKPIDKRIGNNFWTLAKNIGRNRIYQTLEELEEPVTEWLEEMSTETIEITSSNKNGEFIRHVPVPLTIVKMCNGIGIDFNTWKEYKKRKEFTQFITHVEDLIKDQKITYATVGEFKENIVARITGLADKREINAAPTIKVVDMSTFDEEEETED